MTYASVPTNAPKPRSSWRPPLGLFAGVMITICCIAGGVLLFALLFVIVDGDPSAVMAIIACVAVIILAMLGWMLAYIARTLDDIGYASGAPASGLPTPPGPQR